MPSLTLAEARLRAAQLSDVSYDVELDLTGSPATFGSRVTVRFASSGTETFLELHRGHDVSVTVNGAPTDPAYDGHRIALSGLRTGLAEDNEVVVSARLPYVTDGDGMHTFTDPVDGERYVSAYVGVDITQRVFACFDQVDLKAPVALRVVADPGWTVLSNAALAMTQDDAWEFAPTPPIPIDLFVLCAGPWHSRTFEHGGLPMGWHARRSLAAELDRDFDELRRITEQCFDHYAQLFDEPYPFDTYDQVFVPGLNWGAMENPGCVTYRDEFLPRGRVTEVERRTRAMVIAHEMSHMWFGDLVTQVWWEDIWLSESFAEYMGFRVSEDAAGFEGTQVGFQITHKPRALVADRRRSTHPVAPLPEELPDVDTASTNFDAISYVKGASVLRQLVTWMGDEDFLAGVNAHLTKHRFANATLADLVGALDEASPRDVRGWAEVWLRRSGHAGADPVAFTGGLARASRDTDELRRWLADDRTDHDLALDPQLRWRVVHRLAELGGLDAAAIDAERRRDGTANGDLGAATALAARPTAEAKAEAWAALTDDEISNRRFGAITAGLWPAEQAELAAPYLPHYLEAGPRWAARGPAFSLTVGVGFPAFRLDDAQLDLVRGALAGDVPTVLRRHWQDLLDDRV